MKMLTLAAVAVALATSGCVVVPPRSSRAAVRSDQGEKPCPPGHLWSDGKCHSKGKGHDR